MNVSHTCVDNGTIWNSFRSFSLSSCHNFFFRRFFIKNISVRICTFCIFWFSFGKLKRKLEWMNKIFTWLKFNKNISFLFMVFRKKNSHQNKSLFQESLPITGCVIQLNYFYTCLIWKSINEDVWFQMGFNFSLGTHLTRCSFIWGSSLLLPANMSKPVICCLLSTI